MYADFFIKLYLILETRAKVSKSKAKQFDLFAILWEEAAELILNRVRWLLFQGDIWL